MAGSRGQDAAAADANIDLTTRLSNAIMATLRAEMQPRENLSEMAKEEDLLAIVAALSNCAGKFIRHSSNMPFLKQMNVDLIAEWTD